MNIDQLPFEILIKIVKYLPSHKDVLLVSKRFYDVACQVNDSILFLSFDHQFFEKRWHPLLQSIKHSNQKISRMSVDFDNFTETEIRTTMSIIQRFSSTIKYFNIRDRTFASDFNEIFSLLPNVEHLVIGEYRVKNHPMTQKKNHPRNEYPNELHQLKTLELFGKYDEEFVLSLLNRLPAGSLTELRIELNCHINELAVQFNQQTNIKKLTMDHCGELSNANVIFDNLKLESLELSGYKISTNFIMILSKQTGLKFLKLDRVNEDLMNVVVNQLTELETLSLQFDGTIIYSFANIGRLKNLKYLAVRSLHPENVSHFPIINNSRLTSLAISSRGNFTENVLDIIAESAPNLKVFRLQCIGKLNCSKLTSIMRHLNFVEVLQITGNNFSRYFNETVSPQDDECFNQKLIELNIGYRFSYDTPFLNKLIVDYPNLKKLTINSMTPLTAKQFQAMVDGFQKLESLRLLHGASKLTRNDLECLKKKKLQFISFGDLTRAGKMR